VASLCGVGEIVITGEMLAGKYAALLAQPGERSRRVVRTADARMPGHGGIGQVAAARTRKARV
jgi:hypothetical protein